MSTSFQQIAVLPLAPPFPVHVEQWTDGRTWEFPIFRCWLLGHRGLIEISDDLRWTWNRCLRCRCRDKPRLTDLRWLECYVRRALLKQVNENDDARAQATDSAADGSGQTTTAAGAASKEGTA